MFGFWCLRCKTLWRWTLLRTKNYVLLFFCIFQVTCLGGGSNPVNSTAAPLASVIPTSDEMRLEILNRSTAMKQQHHQASVEDLAGGSSGPSSGVGFTRSASCGGLRHPEEPRAPTPPPHQGPQTSVVPSSKSGMATNSILWCNF